MKTIECLCHRTISLIASSELVGQFDGRLVGQVSEALSHLVIDFIVS